MESGCSQGPQAAVSAMPVGDLPGAMVPDRAGRGGWRKQDAVLAYRDVGHERPPRIGGARGRNTTTMDHPAAQRGTR